MLDIGVIGKLLVNCSVKFAPREYILTVCKIKCCWSPAPLTGTLVRIDSFVTILQYIDHFYIPAWLAISWISQNFPASLFRVWNEFCGSKTLYFNVWSRTKGLCFVGIGVDMKNFAKPGFVWTGFQQHNPGQQSATQSRPQSCSSCPEELKNSSYSPVCCH